MTLWELLGWGLGVQLRCVSVRVLGVRGRGDLRDGSFGLGRGSSNNGSGSTSCSEIGQRETI